MSCESKKENTDISGNIVEFNENFYDAFFNYIKTSNFIENIKEFAEKKQDIFKKDDTLDLECLLNLYSENKTPIVIIIQGFIKSIIGIHIDEDEIDKMMISIDRNQ
jgi:hypothetical protein